MERWVPFDALALELVSAGISTLLFDLGYVGGNRMYSGGQREADDILLAAAWAYRRSRLPVVLWGFSAGGHAALLAAQRATESLVAVIADSAFPDSAWMLAQRAARTLHLPSHLLALAPPLLQMMSGARAGTIRARSVPSLLIWGNADEEVSGGAVHKLQQVSGGQL